MPVLLFIPNKFLPVGWGVAQMRPLFDSGMVGTVGRHGWSTSGRIAVLSQADLSTEDDVEAVFTLVTGTRKDLLPTR
jgi:hypothetical protein